jgi:hypothetical protein
MLAAIILAGITVAAWKASGGRQIAATETPAPPLRGQYVSMPHPADRATRRKAEYLARALALPLVADSNATQISVEDFTK